VKKKKKKKKKTPTPSVLLSAQSHAVCRIVSACLYQQFRVLLHFAL
jgi:hypothetical protein